MCVCGGGGLKDHLRHWNIHVFAVAGDRTIEVLIGPFIWKYINRTYSMYMELDVCVEYLYARIALFQCNSLVFLIINDIAYILFC